MIISKEFDEAYYKLNAQIESGNNPKAKAPTSTASGLHQFIRSTWEEMGFDWKDVFDPAVQRKAIVKFTERNAEMLRKAGCAINNATLYGAHFLGVAGFLKIMRALPSDQVASVTTPAQRKANPTILKGTVQDFCNWLEKKTGDKVTKRYNALPNIPVDIPTTTVKKGNTAVLVITALIFVIVVLGAMMFLMR